MSDTTTAVGTAIADLINAVDEALSEKQKGIDHLLSENRKLLDTNRELRLKLDSASHLFGKAFVDGGASLKPSTGPSRPNRHKLTEREAKDIRAAFRGGMKQSALAKNYGVNPATISRLVRGIYH